MVLELLYTNDDGDPRAQETSSNAGDCSTTNNKDGKDIKNSKNSKKDEKIEETEDIVSGLPPSARGTRGRGRDRRVRPTTDDKALPRKNYFRTGSLASKLSDGAEDDLWTKGWEGRSGKASFRSPGATLFEGGFDGAQCRGELNANSNHVFGQRRFGNLGFWESKLVSDFVEGKINGNHELVRKSESGLNGTNVRLIGRSSSWREDVKYQKFSGKIQNRSSIDGLRGSLVEQNFPRIRIGDVACGINGNVEASWFHQEDQIEASQQSQCTCCSIGEIKRLGQTISKGHGKYQLMLSLQLGIRFTVGKANSIKRELIPEDFDPKEKFWTRFPPQGSRTTPAHQLAEFRWKDYCPMVFRHLREILEVDSADYMLAICENGSLRELSSPGKSGSFFYMTQDDNFMIKTLKKSEVKVLLRMLPSYYKHVYQYKNSLITKFFGVHCIKPAGSQKTRFIIMGNLFGSEYRIHRRFDLKGSSHGRMTSKPQEGIDETTTLKDLDLNFIFRLQKFWFQKLNRQIDRDCKFLESERIMDYSLLVGLHFLDCSGNKTRLSPYIVSSGNRNLYQDEVAGRCHFFGMEKKDTYMILSGRRNLIRLGGNMPARAQHVPRSILDQSSPRDGGNITPKGGEVHEVILHFGIIDILQDYDINKKLEHAYKSLQVDPTSISAVDPKLYSSRFRDFIHRIFVEDK